MKAFIPCTQDYLSMAQEAGRRLCVYAGVKSVEYVLCKDKAACHKAKLEHWLDHSGPIIMADADLWVIRPCLLTNPAGNFVWGTPNDSGVEAYAGTAVPPRSALCSSLIGMDMGYDGCRKAVQKAIKLQARDYTKDEVYLNLALFSQPELCVARLSNHWNWCGPPSPEAIAVHAAGRSHKEQWLREIVALQGDNG